MTDKKPVIRTGTFAELHAIRDACRAAAAAAAAMERCGLDPPFAAELRRRVNAMGAKRFAVILPCMLCHEPQPVDVQGGGLDGQRNATPGAVLCGSCDARITAEVEAERAHGACG